MGLASYLPSAQFSLIITSILLAGGLVWAADYYTSPQKPPTIAVTQSNQASEGLDWKTTLASIQGETALPEPPSKDTVANLLAASETPNITETVGRTILVNLGEAKSQGLGSDIPTQEQIVKNALTKISSSQDITLYTASDLTTVDNSVENLTSYGNSVVATLNRHPAASAEAVLVAVGKATDSGDSSYLANLPATAAAYKSIAAELAALPVPQTLSPLHLQVVNNFARIAAACAEMQVVLTDPLLGLTGLKTFQSLTEETDRLFINIAQALSKNGILFSEDEPGYAWNLLVAP